jgi:putative nucleotidyltransferase with HDIG domain
LTYTITTSIKHHSPFNRYFFNFANQLIAGLVYTLVIHLTGGTFVDSSNVIQLLYATMSAVIVYFINTIFISIGMYLDTRNPMIPFWIEQYSWLFPIYLGMGIVAAAFSFGYRHDPIIVSLLVVIPIILLRVSQVQYVDRTREMVKELRQKNTTLENYSDEISKLNDGLLDTLAEVIDLNDPLVLGHSRRVTDFAAKIAKRMGLHARQVELVRKGSLLHDIGKLGIPQNILSKSTPLTPEELETIREHPGAGATLLEKSPHLRTLIPIIQQHHEFYNGEGYPGKLSSNQISVEARIVSGADAIEAMLSDRPYRKARSTSEVIKELQRCSNTQFDPLVVNAAIEMLKEMEKEKRTTNLKEAPKIQIQSKMANHKNP